MTRRGALLAAVAGAALLLASCDDVVGPSDLAGGEWQLRLLEHPAQGVFRPEDPSRFAIRFGEDGSLGITADCNVCGGSYSIEDGRLEVEGVFCTLIACPGAPVDQRFLEVLQGTSTLDGGENELTISSSRGRLELTR